MAWKNEARDEQQQNRMAVTRSLKSSKLPSIKTQMREINEKIKTVSPYRPFDNKRDFHRHKKKRRIFYCGIDLAECDAASRLIYWNVMFPCSILFILILTPEREARNLQLATYVQLACIASPRLASHRFNRKMDIWIFMHDLIV